MSPGPVVRPLRPNLAGGLEVMLLGLAKSVHQDEWCACNRR